jgi:hypothetical protein
MHPLGIEKKPRDFHRGGNGKRSACLDRVRAGNRIKNRWTETQRPPCADSFLEFGTYAVHWRQTPNLSLMLQLAASPKKLSSGLLEPYGD